MSEECVFYTVVYRVESGKANRDEWWRMVRPLFLCDGPISITVLHAGDAIAKLDELEAMAAEEPTA